AALGQFDHPFVPVEIKRDYDGYSWAKVPTIGKVEISVGKTLQEDSIGSGELTCVDSLSIAAHCSDGKVFRSDVCMARRPEDKTDSQWAWTERVYITP